MAENFQNFYVTKLREACDAVATTIYVETVPAITEGTLVLEYANSTKHEIIHFTGVSGYGLTGCTRGLEGTTAQSHSAGTDVRQNLTAGMIDKIINGVITTENIANSAVTTAKINNGAVTADKIDFTTLNMITLRGSYGDSSTSANSQIALDYVQGVVGTKLTKSNNAVKIGAGVSKVLVTASTFYSSNGGAYGWCRIQKNSSDTGFCAIANLAASSYCTATICACILEVQENDVIKLWNNDAAKVRGNASYMTVIALA